MLDEDNGEIEDESLEEMLLDNTKQYLSLDENGYIVRIFNKGSAKNRKEFNLGTYKFDMIGIMNKIND